MAIIKLKSVSGEIFDVDLEVAKMSTTIKTMVESLGVNDDDDEVVPLPLDADVLAKVIEWATYHKDDPPKKDGDQGEKRTDNICKWDQDFLKVDQGTLFKIILAANYLEVQGLTDVSCMTVANMIKGKTPEEIRIAFNIENDFTPEEEEFLRKQNLWCEYPRTQ